MDEFSEEQRMEAYHSTERALMVLLDPEIIGAVVTAVDAIQNAVGLMVEQGLDREPATGSVLGAVIQALMDS